VKLGPDLALFRRFCFKLSAILVGTGREEELRLRLVLRGAALLRIGVDILRDVKALEETDELNRLILIVLILFDVLVKNEE